MCLTMCKFQKRMNLIFYPFTLSDTKTGDNFGNIFRTKAFFWKIFEGEMLTRGQTTTLLQIFCELSLYSQVIFKSMKVADDTF